MHQISVYTVEWTQYPFGFISIDASSEMNEIHLQDIINGFQVKHRSRTDMTSHWIANDGNALFLLDLSLHSHFVQFDFHLIFFYGSYHVDMATSDGHIQTIEWQSEIKETVFEANLT